MSYFHSKTLCAFKMFYLFLVQICSYMNTISLHKAFSCLFNDSYLLFQLFHNKLSFQISRKQRFFLKMKSNILHEKLCIKYGITKIWGSSPDYEVGNPADHLLLKHFALPVYMTFCIKLNNCHDISACWSKCHVLSKNRDVIQFVINLQRDNMTLKIWSLI